MTISTSIIIKPVVTEKTTKENGKYTFIVSLNSNKKDIAEAVKKFFGIKKIENVNTLVTCSKNKFTKFGKMQKKSKQKKAIVTVGKGEKINFNDFK
jgi:ribosomal protein L23